MRPAPVALLCQASERRATVVLLRMTARIRLFTTVTLACQLFLLVCLLTTALRGSAQQQGSPAEEATPAPAAEPNTPTESSNEKQTTKPAEEPRVHPVGDEVIIKARQQEKNGNVFTLSGEVEVSYRDTVLRADEIVYDQSTGDVKANGHVVVEGGTHQEHIEGTSAEYNV